MNLQRAGESSRGGVSAGCVPVRALVGWCLLRRLVYSALRPPTQPTNRQANTRNTAGGWLVPVRSLLCGVCFAGFFILAAPTHPTARKPPRSSHYVAASLRGRAVSTASTKPWDFCAVSAPTRSRPLRGLLRAAFAGCLCAEMLLLALPLPPRPNMAGYFQQPAILWPWREGGASKRGAPTPCPRRPAPPNTLRAAFALPARCSCAPSALRLRGC